MIQDSINEKLKESMKAKRFDETGTFRLLISALKNKEIENRTAGGDGVLSPADEISVLEKEAKKRREAIEIYQNASREDLRAKEADELAIIEQFLPAKMSAEDITLVVDKIITLGASDFASVMKLAVAELKGKADTSLVAKIVKEKLSV